jgi:segregation and condensation protein B
MKSSAAKAPPRPAKAESLDVELADLPAEMRWREWMGRVEAAIFAAVEPVPRDVLARLVGRSCVLDDLITDIRDELKARPYDIVRVAGGFQHRTKPRFAGAIRAAANSTSSASPVTDVTLQETMRTRRFWQAAA